MGEVHKFVVDDEDDTLLFKRLQEHVLQHYPNPERIGCFDSETLVTFVETPGKLDLEDPKYLHILQCAECTRDLMNLRQSREERLAREAQERKRRPSLTWRWAGIAAAVAVIASVGFLGFRMLSNHSLDTARNLQPVPVFLDLSGDGIARDADQNATEATVALPARRIHLRLALPYFSPAGKYRVTISKERSQSQIDVSGSALASSNGSHTELTVELDLTRLARGRYFLGTAREGDGAPYYYPAVVR